MIATPTPGTKDFFTQSHKTNKDPNKDKDTANTPEILWHPALNALGVDAFDLDPFSNDTSIVPAKMRWTLETDKETPTLDRVWVGPDGDRLESVWINHPWSNSRTLVAKVIQRLKSDRCQNITWLTKLDPRCHWWNALLKLSNGYVCLPKGYYKFEGHADVIPHSISIFPIYVECLDEWIVEYKAIGEVMKIL